ncbi:MAG: acetylglutamate kinase [Actinobacteria bacterium]|nr:acetylglutamate kinase [Actinomycetota bacterium]
MKIKKVKKDKAIKMPGENSCLRNRGIEYYRDDDILPAREYMDKVKVLLESLPYIKQYSGRIVVVKIGGSMMEDDSNMESMLNDLVLMKYVGIKVVLIHGGGKQITGMMKQKGITAKFIDGLRVTDREAVNIVRTVLMDEINSGIVSFLNSQEELAAGLSGADGNFINCSKKIYIKDGREVDLGFVGEIEYIDTSIIKDILDRSLIPVIATLGSDSCGNVYNINADTCASGLSIALGAKKMVLMTDVDGIMEEIDGGKRIISRLTARQCINMIEKGKISSGMIPKVKACIKALNEGVERTHILSGIRPHSILVEIFTDKGVGTMITGKDSE